MPSLTALAAKDLAYTYHAQSTPSFQNVSLDVCAGERWLITGASSCGKSTLARCLVGLIPHLYHGKLRGQVSLMGLPTDTTPLWQLAEQAGMVLQIVCVRFATLQPLFLNCHPERSEGSRYSANEMLRFAQHDSEDSD
ncbi:MAG: ATP-binding cassette domain-containing protein [Chloroflexi bacterium]|nr:ATP-binding cassette domain-containing protein [Chloroflexota bacterium]